ncbi:Na/Pi cotransporter family protein [Rubritalea tangerina]|uniref:Na/Pi cotransporter family protein n=1 Tax=Rubritalea tangerina TaxID=430798 RepID=A0ABW4ZAY0_9BACT
MGSILTILTILGALGIFLYGMKVMSEGIQKVAGNGMRRALATMTTNRFSSVVTGLFTTALVQSSSATTVLVVSFVNVGLLTLVESIGVIMGANLGTTVTAWIVATIGKFSVTKIALPIIGCGLPLFFAGKGKWKSMGEVLIGFGLLFFGLGELKNAVPDLKSTVKDAVATGDMGAVETMRNIVTWIQGTGFASVILFMIAGVILTLVVQSSSAAMAITITFAMQGWLGDDPYIAFKNSAAIVLGENIGTTVTAWLASLGASTAAKRAARAHLLFNVIGVVWMLIFFGVFTNFIWSLADMLPDSLKSAKKDFGKSEVAFATAVFHTSFNLINIGVLIWFVPQIANLVQKMVKDKDTDEPGETKRIKYISQSLVDLGELNIVEAEQAVEALSQHCSKMFQGYVEVFENPQSDMSEHVKQLKEMEDEADLMMHDITEYLVRCTSKEVSPHLSERITGLLRMTAELEECSDAIYRLIKIAERKYNKGRQFSSEQTQSIKELNAHISEFLTFCEERILGQVSPAETQKAEDIREKIKSLTKSSNKAAMKRMADGNVKLEMLNIDTNNQLNIVANHLMHVVQTSAEVS